MEIRLWGAVSVVVNGREERPTAGRTADLLACLAWQPGELVCDEVLTERIWGESVPADPRDALYSCAKRLRRALAANGAEAAALVRGRTGYLLQVEPDRVDIHRFRRLVRDADRSGEPSEKALLYGRALRAARGRPLAGFDSSWAARVRHALMREQLAAQLAAASSWARLGCHREVIAELTELTVEHPLNEAVAGLLMNTLEQAGQPAEALLEYVRIRKGLSEELGAMPGSELVGRFEQLLRAENAAVPASTETAGAPVRARHGATARRSDAVRL